MTRVNQLLSEFRATMRFIFGHPANRGHRGRALARFFAWQLWKRATGRPLTIRFWKGMRLLAYPDSKSAGLALYTQLPEYDDMLFVQRYLRPNDVFVDVGANIGLYSLLAGSVVGDGRVLAFEPHPLAARRLRNNARLNGLNNVRVQASAIGAHAGSAKLTTSLDTINHIVQEPDGQGCIEVPMTTLDAEAGDYPVALVKIDTEGFETEVLRGAEALFQQRQPPVWIVEVNGLGKRYGLGDDSIREIFSKHGYRSYRYDADRNVLEPSDEVGASERDWNLIFVHQVGPVRERLVSPPPAAVSFKWEAPRRRFAGDDAVTGSGGGIYRWVRDALSYNTFFAVAAIAVGFIAVLLSATVVFGLYALLIGLVTLVTVAAVDSTVQLRLSRRAQKQIYRQIDALFSMFAVLKITQPLPPMRGWAISPDFANVLISLIHEHRPTRILEAGSGVSTLVAGYCLKQIGSGTIVSLDQDPAFAAIARNNVRKHGLQEVARVLYAPLKEVAIGGQDWLWYDTEPIGGLDQIDMVIVDGPSGDIQKLARYPALPLLHHRLSDDAVIVLDDCIRPEEREIVDRWLEDFDGFVSQDVETEKGTIVLRRLPSPAPALRAARRKPVLVSKDAR